MNGVGLAALPLLACLSATVCAQEPVPQILIRAAQCLTVKNFLPPTNAGKLTFGYVLDEQSYPGDKVIYLVAYADPVRSNGSIFAIFLTAHDGRENFNIQNNASFVLSKSEPIGVSFINPPLGGTWTQEHLASAINRIERQPKITISVKDLLVVAPHTDCQSYTDH